MIPESILDRARSLRLYAGQEVQIAPNGALATRVWLGELDGHGASIRTIAEAADWESLEWPK